MIYFQLFYHFYYLFFRISKIYLLHTELQLFQINLYIIIFKYLCYKLIVLLKLFNFMVSYNTPIKYIIFVYILEVWDLRYTDQCKI